MPDTQHPNRPTLAQRRARRRIAMHLQAMEGNPLDAADIEMFEMFDRQGWDTEQRVAYIIKQAEKPAPQ